MSQLVATIAGTRVVVERDSCLLVFPDAETAEALGYGDEYVVEDVVSVTRDGDEVSSFTVPFAESPEPYDEALAERGLTDVTWAF